MGNHIMGTVEMDTNGQSIKERIEDTRETIAWLNGLAPKAKELVLEKIGSRAIVDLRNYWRNNIKAK